VFEERHRSVRARLVAARVGVQSLVDDDAVQLAIARATAAVGVGEALVGRPGAGQDRFRRRWAHLVVTVPAAALTQQRGGLLPQGLLEVRRRRSAEGVVDGSSARLVTTAEEAFVDAAGVAPPGERLRGQRQLLVRDLHLGSQQFPHRPRCAS